VENGGRFVVPLVCVLVGLVLTATLHPTTLVFFLGVGFTTAGLVLGLRRLRAPTQPVPPAR
jgi:hypothetical protein